jgi:SpoVK/Ycf46/Vps4 family AAA+-type ATPase
LIIPREYLRKPLWGESDKQMKKLFTCAAVMAPCMIVLEEADALIGGDDRDVRGGQDLDRKMGTEMQKYPERKDWWFAGVFVVLTTNRETGIPDAIKSRCFTLNVSEVPLRKADYFDICMAVMAQQFKMEVADQDKA